MFFKKKDVMTAKINGVEVKGTPEQIKEVVKMLSIDKDKEIAPVLPMMPAMPLSNRATGTPKHARSTHIQYERLTRGWTQNTVAEKVGCSSSHYGKIELRNARASHGEAIKISLLFKKEIDALFDSKGYAKERI